MTHGKTPHITFVSQIVRDIHLPSNLPSLAEQVGRLWAWLKTSHFIPKEKVTGDFSVVSLQPDGTVTAKLTGTSLVHDPHSFGSLKPSVELSLPLGLAGYHGPLDTHSVFEAIPGATVESGGNVQNMLLDSVILAAALERSFPEFSTANLKFTVASSSDPFRGTPEPAATLCRLRATVFPLALDDRLAIILPRQVEDNTGVLNVTSEPKLTEAALERLLTENENFARAFQITTTFVSTDPLVRVLPNYAKLPYTTVINASTAFRALAAVHAYDTATLLPMNESEAAAVCQILLSRAGVELSDAPPVPFPSPLALSGDGLDFPSLRSLNDALSVFGRYIHAHRSADGSLRLSYPISFGSEGGLIVGVNGRTVACFTSVPSKEGEKRLFDEHRFECTDTLHETGAGDSVAALMTLFNTVSAEVVVCPYLKGDEKHRTAFRLFAGALFVAIAGRLVGNILVRTTHTNMSRVNVEELSTLLCEAAEEAVTQARLLFKTLPHPAFSVAERWGIRCACWSPTEAFLGDSAVYDLRPTAEYEQA